MGDFITIARGPTEARISPIGGALVDARFEGQPFVRPYKGGVRDFTVGQAASFPLVPFGNRVAGNAFLFGGREYRLTPNTAWDPHYLHGDGWTGRWAVTGSSAARADLALEHPAAIGQPYAYRAAQTIKVLDDGALRLVLVLNVGDTPLPFGLGHHLFFPKQESTTLLAPASSYWTERDGFLPDENLPIPESLDFSAPRRLPSTWVNNGFEGWNGRATIDWPGRRLSLDIEATDAFGRYFVFISSTDFEPSFRGDYFCFEPMTHSADGHHHPGLSGLQVLAQGEVLTGEIALRPRRHEGTGA